jgi:hypothetical protein
VPRPMDRVEEAIILECLRDVRRPARLGLAKSLAGKLVAAARNVDDSNPIDLLKKATDCIDGRPIGADHRSAFAEVALSILLDPAHYENVRRYYEAHNPNIFAYLNDIASACSEFQKQQDHSRTMRNPADDDSFSYSNMIFTNWNKPFRKGDGILRSAVYQLFRRYKSQKPRSRP